MFNKIEKEIINPLTDEEIINPLTDEEILNDSTGMTEDERNNLG